MGLTSGGLFGAFLKGQQNECAASFPGEYRYGASDPNLFGSSPYYEPPPYLLPDFFCRTFSATWLSALPHPEPYWGSSLALLAVYSSGCPTSLKPANPADGTGPRGHAPPTLRTHVLHQPVLLIIEAFALSAELVDGPEQVHLGFLPAILCDWV